MPARNRRKKTEVRLMDKPKDPPPDGESSNPTQPGIVQPPPKGDDDSE